MSNEAKRLWNAFGVLVAGILSEYIVLAAVELWYITFPAVPDVIMDHLPRVDFGWWGELVFFGLLVVFGWLHIGRQRSRLPDTIMALGLFYALRSVFLLLLPIGAPMGALPASEKLSIWGFAGHGFFPGGHAGMMMVLAMRLQDKTWRRMMIAAVLVFSFGSVLSKNHYSADIAGGVLLAYAVHAWFRLHRDQPTGSD